MNDSLRLIEAEIPHLRRYARYIVRDSNQADDLVQECLARAVAKIDSWQPGTNLRAWLFVILKNCHINAMRRSQAAPTVDAENHQTPSAEANQEAHMMLMEVRNAFLRLSQEHREVLLLVAIEGLQYQEAAAVLNVQVGTVRSRLSRARQALRQTLEESEGRQVDQETAPRAAS